MPPSDSPRPGLERHWLLLPTAAAVLLCIPVMGFMYLWDDYSFLSNAMLYRLKDWLPDPNDPFYRPISRGVYFSLLDIMGPNGAALGHFLNICFLIAIASLLGLLTAKLAGKRAGLIAGLLFTGIGAVPDLVGWVCCDQDLLAILFVLLALYFRLERRNVAALIATAAALLSKETSLAVIPAIALFDWIIARRPYKVLRSVCVYAALIAAWGAIHPGVRILVGRGLRSGATGYVGLEHPERWPLHVGRYLLTLLNIPAFAPLPSWPDFGVLLAIASVGLVALAIHVIRRLPESKGEGSERAPRSRVILLGALIGIGPLVLTSFMIKGWAAYYAAFPAIGSSMIAGAVLATVSHRALAIGLSLYFTFGIWSRGDVNPAEATESNHRAMSKALQKVSLDFRTLYPQLPPDAQVLLSIQARKPPGFYIHMYFLQVLRTWYRDRSVHTYRPEARKPTTSPELLVVITPDREVIDINTRTLFARSASNREPDYHSCEMAVRAYSMGLAGSGETNEAVRTLLHMPEINRGLTSVHRRMAAMFLLAEGRATEALAVLDSTVSLPRDIAITDVFAVLAEQPPGRVFDEFGLKAFGIAPNDVGAIRELMRRFSGMKYAEVALRFVRRLNELGYSDRESETITRRMTVIVEERRAAEKLGAAIE